MPFQIARNVDFSASSGNLSDDIFSLKPEKKGDEAASYVVFPMGIDGLLTYKQHALWQRPLFGEQPFKVNRNVIFPCTETDDCPGCDRNVPAQTRFVTIVLTKEGDIWVEKVFFPNATVAKAIIAAYAATNELAEDGENNDINNLIFRITNNGHGKGDSWGLTNTGKNLKHMPELTLEIEKFVKEFSVDEIVAMLDEHIIDSDDEI